MAISEHVIRSDGVVYCDLKAAARSVEGSQLELYFALRRGTEWKGFRWARLTRDTAADLLRSGFPVPEKWLRPKKGTKSETKKRPKKGPLLRSDGLMFPSVAVAAMAMQINPWLLRRAVRQGKIVGGYGWSYSDSVPIERSVPVLSLPPVGKGKANARPVIRSDGVVFENTFVAADSLRYPKDHPKWHPDNRLKYIQLRRALKGDGEWGGYYWRYLRRSSDDIKKLRQSGLPIPGGWGEARRKAKRDAKRDAEKAKGKPVVRSDGQRFSSVEAAAKAMGISLWHLCRAVNKGSVFAGFGWSYGAEPDAEPVAEVGFERSESSESSGSGRQGDPRGTVNEDADHGILLGTERPDDLR